MYRYIDVIFVDQDPAVIMAAHLKMTGNKYERALCKTLQKIAICHTSDNKFPVPECPELFQIPFVETEIAKNEEIVSRLTESCIHWYEIIEKTIKDLPTTESLKETSPIVFPKAQIDYWRKRQEDLIQLIDDFTFPAFERAVGIMEAANVQEIETLKIWMDKTKEYLEEADDHVRFLGTIESSLEVIATTDNFDQISETIPGVASSLRNIWLLSKCFNTDAKIHSLIFMISQLINERVVNAIQLIEFKNPDILQFVLKSCVTVLEIWKKSFLKTRMDIEQSRKEKRWEFDLNYIFADTDHINVICKDMILICKILMEIKNCFSEDMKQITSKPKFLQAAIEKIDATIQGLYEMKFNPFDKNSKHHWVTLMAWFQREVLFLEAESGKIIEETFDSLIKSEYAVSCLKKLKKKTLREVIGRKYMKKVDCVIEKFSKEIDDADELFENKKDDPPVQENLPPISGSIYWSQGIGAELKATLMELTSLDEIVQYKTWPEVKVKLDKVLKKMDGYEVGKYTDWRNKVSDVLDQNLGKNLVKRDGDLNGVGKFIVNFTSDLSDTFAEVVNMEKIGFKVPEVAKNMSMQESKLLDIADQLQKMLDHYHEVISSVEGAELELLLEDLQATEIALQPGFKRLTWNSLGINDYINQSDIHVCRTESTIRQIHTIKNTIQRKVDRISSCKVFDKFKALSNSKLKNFRDFHHDIMENQKVNIDTLVREYEDIGPLLMKVEEILVKSRTKRHRRLGSYYSFWESQVYAAVINFIKINLDDLYEIMESPTPLFKVEVVLDGLFVAISPSEQMILKGVVTIVKYLLEGSKEFIRWCRGSCIPVHEVRVKGEIKPVRPSFFDDLIGLPDMIDKVMFVQNSLVKTLEDVQSYLGSWKTYKNLWKFNKQETCDKFLERTPSCVDFDEKLLYYSLLERQVREREQNKVFKCLEVYLGPIKETLLKETQMWIECLGKLLEQTAKQELHNLISNLENLESNLIYPKNGEELESVLQAISTIWGMSLSVEITYREIEERYRTLQMYGLQIEKAQVDSAQSLPERWDKIFRKSKEVHFRVTPLKEKYTEITKMQILKFLKEVDTLETKFYDSGPGSVGASLDEGLLLLRHFKTQLSETIEKGNSLNKQEKLYVLPVTQFTILQTLTTEMDTLNEIYEAYQTYLDFEEKWKTLTWRKLDLDIVSKEVINVEEVLTNLKKKYAKADTLQEIVKRKDRSKRLFAILKKLKESKLRPRHWREICTAANISRDKDDDFNIINIWNVDLDMFSSNVDRIINLASNERTIEGDLQEIKEIWEATKFSLNRISFIEGGEKFFCLGDVHKILEQLLIHDNTMDAMAKSEYSKHFSKEIQYWKKTLSKIGDVTQEWVSVQEKWKDLSKVFAIKGFKDSLENANGFEDLNKRFSRIMTETTKKPTVKDSCLIEDRFESLKCLNSELEEFQKYLLKALELRRKQFSRFFFLSDEELITVLGGSIRDPMVQRLVKKLFKRLSSFIPDELGIIEVIYTNDQEDLPLCKPVNTAIHSIEIWLSELLEESKVSSKLMLRWAHKDCDLLSSNFLESILKFPNVHIIAAFEMVWTDVFQTCFEKGLNKHPNHVMEEWKGLFKLVMSLFEQLSEMNRSNSLTPVDIRKHNLLLTLLLSKRDLIQKFQSNYIHSKADFNWEKLLKYIWSQESGHVQIEQCFSITDYGYEFMGVDSVGVDNPESERVWFQINESIRNHNIPLLSGVPGSGKSQAIGNLATRLAKFCYNMNMNENFNMNVMTQFLRGVCESNIWGNMENINLLTGSIMSIISSHFQTIRTAQTIHLREFTLDNQVTRMYPEVAFLCTENIVPGSNHLKKIPLSLKTLLRKTSVQLPDMTNLLCVILRVNAFKKPVTMSRNLVKAVENVFKIISVKNYNKIRMYKFIIQKATKMLNMDPEKPEGLIFFKVLCDYFESLLSSGEFLLTRGFLLKTYEIDDQVNLESEKAISTEKHFEKIGLTYDEDQSKVALKIVESLEMINSVIIVGEASVGKSSLIDVALEILSEKTIFKKTYLNVTSYDEVKILGDSKTEGIISKILSESDEHQVFHIDGKLPESIAFPLSFLVDENEYMNGSGKKQVPKHITKFVLEAEKLEDICPSFVARSVIISVESPGSVLPTLILNSRTKKYGNSEAKKVRNMFNAFESVPIVKKHSTVDTFLNRNKSKQVNEMMDIMDAISKTSNNTKETANYFVYSYFMALSACFSESEKEVILGSLKDCVDSNKTLFEDCTIHTSSLTSILPMKNPMTEKTVSWASQSKKQLFVQLALSLLRNNTPVLLIGENFAEEVIDEITNTIMNSVETSKLFLYELHSLSSAEVIIDDLYSKMQKRGKSILVPKDCREIILHITDLATSVNENINMIPSFVKDLIEYQQIFHENQSYCVKDTNLLCKLSIRDKLYKDRRSLSKFVCLFTEDNFQDTNDLFVKKLKEKTGQIYEKNVSKIGKALKFLIDELPLELSSVNIKSAADIMQDILKSILEKSYNSPEDIEIEFNLQLHQSFISPTLDYGIQNKIEEWIRKSLNMSDLKFAVEYDINLTEDHFPSDVNPTKQQYQQCKEVIYFLKSSSKLISLYGKYGYGKTVVLNVAADYAGFQLQEVRTLTELRQAASNTRENNLIMLRDTYIEKEQLKEWLGAINTSMKPKIAFLMSPKTESLVPWQQQILAKTQVVGIQFWNKESLREVIEGTEFSSDVKDILIEIHLLVVKFCESNNLSHEKVSITSCHFFELLSRVEESVDKKINCNKLRVEDLKSIVKSIGLCQNNIKKFEKELAHTNQLLGSHKEQMKSIKKNLKSLNEELDGVGKEVEQEEKVHEDLQAEIEKLKCKHEEIKEKSFDDYNDSLEQLSTFSTDEKLAFGKPLVVHEDIEKICTILMILLKMDIFGWKPFKDKFLSEDWIKILKSLNPDQCKHKQVFIINKKMKEIKTPKEDMRTVSPIAFSLWRFIVGVLKAFTTEFERSKLMKEIEKVQVKLDESEKKLSKLKEEELKIKEKINQKNKSFEDTMKTCTKNETEALDLQKNLGHEEAYIAASSFFLQNCEKQIKEFQVDEKAALQEAIIQETVGTYLGAFDNNQRLQLLQNIKSVVDTLSESGISNDDFLSNFDLLAIDADLTDNMSNLTSKRLLFCLDPNDLVALSLEREGEGGKRSIKLYDEEDIERIREFLKDEECSCILIEDAYFENKKIMNKLLDECLFEMTLLAEQNDKFIFIITKVEDFSLPHKAYSKLYFINLNLSYSEVIRLMMSQFNKHIMKEEDERLTELLHTQEELEDEITDLEEIVVKSILKRTTKMEDESILLGNLKELEGKTNSMTETKNEIKRILYAINLEKSNLTKCASPIIVALYCLSKMDLCTKPSFHNFCEATKKLYDDLENKDELMFSIYTMFSFQLKEELRSLMVSFMALVYQVMENAIPEDSIGIFIDLSKDLSESLQYDDTSVSKPQWISSMEWGLLVKYNLHDIFVLKEKEWKIWKETGKNVDEEMFNILLISMTLDYQKFSKHLIGYVENIIGKKYLKSDTIIVADVHSYSSPNDPIVFLLGSSNEEPSSDLTRLADLQGIASSKVKYLALSEKNINLAMDLLETAFIRGQWLIFQNVDLVPYFLPILDKKIQEKDDDDVHEDFRVWMTWNDSQLPTFSLLQRAVILSCEPCRDIRYHNSNFLYNIPLKIVRQQEFFQSILFFTYCYLQKVFASRQKFSALSWADTPEFPNYLMQTTYQFFSQYFNVTQDSIRNIQYKQLLQWTKEFLYFNHMTNNVDRTVISMYLDEYIGQFLFEQHNPFRCPFTTRDALEEIITLKIEELKNIPGITSGMIMLAPAADDLYQIKTSSKMSNHIVNFFQNHSNLKMEEAVTQLSILLPILEKAQILGDFTVSSLIRWKIIGFEVKHVKKSAERIIEELERINKCFLGGDWPSGKTLKIINDIIEGKTPAGWR